MRLAVLTCAAMVLLTGTALGQQPTPPPLVGPPPVPVEPSGPKGIIEIGERTPATGARAGELVSFATLVMNDDQNPATAEPYHSARLPYGRRTLVGTYLATAFQQVELAPGIYDDAINKCAANVTLRREGEIRRLTVLRSEAGCRIVVEADRKRCKKAKRRGGRKAKRACRSRPLSPVPIEEPPPFTPIGKPPVIPTVGTTPIFHDFGSVTVGSTSPTQTFTFGNESTTDKGPLSIVFNGSGVGQFSVTNDGCSGTTLAPGATCTFDIAFAPASSGFLYLYLNAGYPGGAGHRGAEVRGTGV